MSGGSKIAKITDGAVSFDGLVIIWIWEHLYTDLVLSGDFMLVNQVVHPYT